MPGPQECPQASSSFPALAYLTQTQNEENRNCAPSSQDVAVPLLLLAKPTFQLHTPQKKCPSHLTSQPRNKLFLRRSPIFSSRFGARKTPVHFHWNVTPAALNLRSSLFKEVTLPHSFSFFPSLSFSVILDGHRCYSSIQNESFPKSHYLISACPCDPSNLPSAWSHLS